MFWRDLASALVLWRAHTYFGRFLAGARDLQRVQEKVLLTKVRRNAQSDFGRRHHFPGIDSVEEFRRRVPVSRYEYLEPYINRVWQGETTALFGPGEEVEMFALTSGTTDTPKRIPVTRSFLEEYRRGWLIWGWGAYRSHRLAFAGDLLNVVSRPDEQRTSLGVPCGAVSGLMSQMQPWVVRGFYALPSLVNCVEEAESKYYLILRLTMPRSVTLCCTPNPSTLVRLSEMGNQCARELIQDIERGGVSPRRAIPDGLREQLARRLRPRRRVARRLAELLERNGRLLPRDYWPNLELLGIWKGGTVSLYLSQLVEAFGPVATRDIGLIASEGRMSIPLSDEGSAGPLDLLHQFFEFIPEEEADREQPETLLPHEVEIGRRYYVVLTTSGGCYRYNIMDQVEVVDRYHEAPVIEFLNKGEHVSSLTGEKLTENQVVRALRRVKEALGLPPTEEVTVTPVWDDPPYYAALLPEGSLGAECWPALLVGLERELCASNMEYAQKRKSGRLGPPRLRVVSATEAASAPSQRDGRLRSAEQRKHVFLVADIDYHKRFAALHEITCVAGSQ